MGKKGGGGNEAAQARQDEQLRQMRIRAGTAKINAIFDGGTIPDNQFGLTLPEQVAPGSGGWGAPPAPATPGKPGAVPPPAGTTYKGAFTEKFFNDRQKSFIDYAAPQVQDQYAKARDELTFSLDRGGLLNSSVRSQQQADLQKKLDLNNQNIKDQALSYKTQAQTSVEDARANLIGMLNATGDAEGAAQSALHRAAALSAPPTFNPLTNLFADFTAGLGTQAAAERASALSGGIYKSPYDTGLFSPKGAVKVT